MNRSLSVLSDAQGTVTLGFLAQDVYYIRIAGHVSSKIGIELGLQLREQLGGPTAMRVFIDLASVQGGTFGARSAIMRALLATRRQLSSVAVLVGSGPSATRARTMTAMLGRPSQIIDSAALFQVQLLEAAPSARSKIAPASSTVRAAPSGHVVARSSRPRVRTA
jgi:hypothetical protein